MVERCQNLSLTLEASHALTVPRVGFGKHFDRDVALQLGVPRAVHVSHAAASELGVDLVVGERLSDHGVGTSRPSSSNQLRTTLKWMRPDTVFTARSITMRSPSGETPNFLS